ncbi:MAG: hypothetical protein ACFB10_13780 [Salibacteraceae bacterium]
MKLPITIGLCLLLQTAWPQTTEPSKEVKNSATYLIKAGTSLPMGSFGTSDTAFNGFAEPGFHWAQELLITLNDQVSITIHPAFSYNQFSESTYRYSTLSNLEMEPTSANDLNIRRWQLMVGPAYTFDAKNMRFTGHLRGGVVITRWPETEAVNVESRSTIARNSPSSFGVMPGFTAQLRISGDVWLVASADYLMARSTYSEREQLRMDSGSMSREQEINRGVNSLQISWGLAFGL